MNSLITQTLMIPSNGVQLHVETAGPTEGPLVILLHGFPEFWYGWKNQISALARSGFYVIIPDQRGYAMSDRPEGIASYQIDQLSRDVLGIIDYFHREKAALIGHDWGGAVAWYTALTAPERLNRLGILNLPHPAALNRAYTQPVIKQLLRSWYILFFQLQNVSNFLVRIGKFAFLRQMLIASSLPNTFSPEDLQRYQEAWGLSPRRKSQLPATTAMMNWYRANFNPQAAAQTQEFLKTQNRVSIPTLILWGEKDVALIPELAQWSLEYCDQAELVRFPEASHWLQHDEPVRVSNRLIDFLRDSRFEKMR